eukprot:Tbor_TRINITY_DN5427_c0_g1::TRINITY_DN5427_c0_g1_i12::g.25105::m.25105
MLGKYNNSCSYKSDIDWRRHTSPSNGRKASPKIPSSRVLSSSPYRTRPGVRPPSRNRYKSPVVRHTSQKHIGLYKSKVYFKVVLPKTRVVISPPTGSINGGNRIVSLPPNWQADHVKQFPRPNVSTVCPKVRPTEMVILRDATLKYIGGPMKRITRELNVNNAFPDQLTRAAAKEALRMKSSALMGRSPIRAQSPPKVPNSRVASDMWANSHNSPIEYNRKNWYVDNNKSPNPRHGVRQWDTVDPILRPNQFDVSASDPSGVLSKGQPIEGDTRAITRIPVSTTVIQHSQWQHLRQAAADGKMTTYPSMGQVEPSSPSSSNNVPQLAETKKYNTENFSSALYSTQERNTPTSLQNGSGNGCDSSLSPSRCSIPIWEPPANDGYNHGLHGQPLDCSTLTNTNISTPVTTVSHSNRFNKNVSNNSIDNGTNDPSIAASYGNVDGYRPLQPIVSPLCSSRPIMSNKNAEVDTTAQYMLRSPVSSLRDVEINNVKPLRMEPATSSSFLNLAQNKRGATSHHISPDTRPSSDVVKALSSCNSPSYMSSLLPTVTPNEYLMSRRNLCEKTSQGVFDYSAGHNRATLGVSYTSSSSLSSGVARDKTHIYDTAMPSPSDREIVSSRPRDDALQTNTELLSKLLAEVKKRHNLSD